MNTSALGLLEVTGIAASLEAADLMSKTAILQVLAVETCGDRRTLAVQGEAVHIRAALDAVLAAPGLEGRITAHALIPAPHPALELLLPTLE